VVITSHRAERQSYALAFPTDLAAKPVVACLGTIGGLLPSAATRLSGGIWPTLVFELFSSSRGLSYRLRLPAKHAAYITAQLRTLIPGIRITPVNLPVQPTIPTRVVELGLRHLDRTVRVADPAITAASLLASLRSMTLRGAEVVVMQWVVGPAVPERPPAPTLRPHAGHGPWSGLVSELLAAGQDRKDERDDQRAKLAQPTVLAVLRIGAIARSDERARQLLRPLSQALRSVQTPANGFHRRLVPQRVLRTRLVEAHTPWQFPVRLSTSELAGLLAWPLDNPQVAGLPRTRTANRPATGAIPSQGGPIIAHSDFPGAERPLCITPDDLTTHVLVAGRTGTGKTTLLCSIAEQLIKANYSIVLIETKGDETGQTLFRGVLERIPKHRVDDTIIIDVADEQYATGYNLLDEINPRIAVEQLCALFEHLYRDSRGVYVREALYHGLMTLIARPGYSFVDLLPLLSPRDRQEEAWHDELVEALTDHELQDFWRRLRERSDQARFVQPVIDRVWQLNARPEIRRIIGQSRSSFSLREALEQHKVLLINLSGVGESTALLAGSLLTNSLWMAIKSARVDRPNFVFLDEWASLLDLPVPMDELLSRSRGYQHGLFLANQHVSGLPLDVRGAALTNTASMIVFAGGNDDARLFAREFGGHLTEDDFKNLGRYHAIARLAAGGETHGPVTGITVAPSKPTGLAAQVRAASRRRYGRAVDEVEREIRERRTPRNTGAASKRPRIGSQRWE
jgi:energy-coupling factor transporter ATP-binding protein EcfA2